jgi:hypothetical protein
MSLSVGHSPSLPSQRGVVAPILFRSIVQPVLIAAFSAGAALAQAQQSELERAAICYDAKDWRCAFDGLTSVYLQDQGPACLEDEHHGCGYELIAVSTAAVGLLSAADVPSRKDIADRALAVMNRLTEGEVTRSGEVFVSAVRYDACRLQGNSACADESAGLIRRFMANQGGTDMGAAVEDLSFYLSGWKEHDGIVYPADLKTVFGEIGLMEQKE